MFQFFPLGALGGYYLLHDPGAACCVWDGETTAGAAATTTAETGWCSCALSNSWECREPGGISDVEKSILISDMGWGVNAVWTEKMCCAWQVHWWATFMIHSLPPRSCWGPTLECLVGCRAWCLLHLARCERQEGPMQIWDRLLAIQRCQSQGETERRRRRAKNWC